MILDAGKTRVFVLQNAPVLRDRASRKMDPDLHTRFAVYCCSFWTYSYNGNSLPFPSLSPSFVNLALFMPLCCVRFSSFPENSKIQYTEEEEGETIRQCHCDYHLGRRRRPNRNLGQRNLETKSSQGEQ